MHFQALTFKTASS